MRTVIISAIALAVVSPLTAFAASGDAYSAYRDMLGAFQHVTAVRIVEKFENGAVATVDFTPPNSYQVANAAGEPKALVVQIATQPDAVSQNDGNYHVAFLGSKKASGDLLFGYRLTEPDGAYDETVWVNQKHLPVVATVHVDGQTVNVAYGDYDASPVIAENATSQ